MNLDEIVVLELIENLYKKYVNKSTVCPNGESMITCAYKHIDSLEKRNAVLHKLFELGEKFLKLNEIADNDDDYTDDYTIDDFSDEMDCVCYKAIHSNEELIFLLKAFDTVHLSDNDIEIFTVRFFNESTDNEINIYFDWLIKKHFDINKKCKGSIYDSPESKTIFSMYLDKKFDSHLCIPQVIDNIHLFIKHDIMIEQPDLEKIANIIIHANQSSSLDELYNYLENYFDKCDLGIIECAMIFCKEHMSKKNFIKIVESSNLIKLYTFDCHKDPALIISGFSGLLANPLIDIDILKTLMDKYSVYMIHSLPLLLNNQSLNVEMLKILPKNIVITTQMLKIAGSNHGMKPEIAIGVLKYLIERI